MYKDREKKKKKHQDLYTSQTGSTQLRLVLTFRPEAVAFNSTTDAPVRVKKKIYSVHFIFITFFFFCLIYKFPPTASVRVCVCV